MSTPYVSLTTRQEDILAYIVRRCMASAGIPPTVREVGKAVGISSTSVVRYHLHRLVALGEIRMELVSSRSIEVVGATWTPPPHLAHLADEEVAAA